MKDWTMERCSEQPDELQVIAPGILMQRRNIRQVDHEEDEQFGDAYTEWMCESREIAESEYHMLKSIEEIDAASAIDEYTQQLIEEGIL